MKLLLSRTLCLAIITLCSSFLVSHTSHAVTLDAGDSVKLSFDFTGDPTLPPYDSLSTSLGLGPDLWDGGATLTLTYLDSASNQIGISSYTNPLSSGIGNVNFGSQTLDTALSTFNGFVVVTSLDSAFDLNSVSITGINGSSSTNFVNATFVPVPPAFYLFGSGLLGLVGMARRKKAA